MAIALLPALGIPAPVLVAGPVPAARRFVFDPASLAEDATRITPDEAFDPARGCGFDLGTRPGAGNRPFYFSVAVPEGTYEVTATLGGGDSASDTTVRAECRQLLLEHVVTRPGLAETRRFLVNVRTPRLPPPPRHAPGGTAVVLGEREAGWLRWDDKLTLEFDGPAPRVAALEIRPVDAPVVYLAGDSTVTDQPAEPGASWGQMLPRFLPGVAVANHAESGETLKSFLTELRLAKVLSRIRPGDYLFIQFGHNDEKANWPQTYAEARTTFSAYLRAYLAEARLRGAIPVLVTPIQRRVFDAAGHIRNTHGDYPEAIREVAAAEHVPLLDLARLSATLYESLGPSRAPLAFSDGGRDLTHTNNYGAYELAQCVVQAIRDSRLPLAAQVAADFRGFDPARPDPPEMFALPPSLDHAFVMPRGN